MAYYSIEEIKIAALDTMMENSTLSITGMPFLAAMLAKLVKPEPMEAETENRLQHGQIVRLRRQIGLMEEKEDG